MKLTKITKIPGAIAPKPDLSNFTDDLLGPDLSASAPVRPPKKLKDKTEESKVRMIQSKRRLSPFIDQDADNEEYEEENEEGKLDSDSQQTEEQPPKLTNHEQGLSHGFNPHVKQTADKWKHDKQIDVKSIPRILKPAIESMDPIDITFNQIKNLPSYLKNPMRALERPLFSLLTITPINDIQVVAHVDGHGPNSKEEMDSIEKWLKLNGIKDFAMLKGLPAKIKGVQILHTEGITHLLVSNSAGRFAFSWPSFDNQIISG